MSAGHGAVSETPVSALAEDVEVVSVVVTDANPMQVDRIRALHTDSFATVSTDANPMQVDSATASFSQAHAAEVTDTNPMQVDSITATQIGTSAADVSDANPMQVDSIAASQIIPSTAAVTDANPMQVDSVTTVPGWPLRLSDGESTLTVRVEHGGHSIATAPRVESTRGYQQRLVQHHYARDRRASIRTALLENDDADALVALLKHVGTLTATGYLVDGTRTVAVNGAPQVDRWEGGPYASVSFEMLIEDPSV